MNKLIKPPTPDEQAALQRIAETYDGARVFAWLQQLAAAHLTASCGTDSDAKARQHQGAWMVLEGFLTTARPNSAPTGEKR